MPGCGGLEALEAIGGDPRTREIPVIVITAFGGSEQTIAAMKAGAYDYITKPFDPEEVLRTTARAIARRRSSASEPEREQDVAGGIEVASGLIGRDPAMREIFKLIGRVAPTDATVLITGESGTGKEVVARALHEHSRRARRQLVVVNCAAIPEALLESELFGYERGAFTGAVQSKPGRLEAANEGIAFPRRDRRAGALAASQAAACAPGTLVRTAGRQPAGAHGLPAHRGDEPEPEVPDRNRTLPRRPVLPPERGPAGRPSPARPAQRHSRARRAFPSARRNEPGSASPRVERRGNARPDEARFSRQRARARKHRPPRRGPRVWPGDRRGRSDENPGSRRHLRHPGSSPRTCSSCRSARHAGPWKRR